MTHRPLATGMVALWLWSALVVAGAAATPSVALDDSVYLSDGIFHTSSPVHDSFATMATLCLANEVALRWTPSPWLDARLSVAAAYAAAGETSWNLPVHVGLGLRWGPLRVEGFAGYYVALGSFPDSGLDAGVRVQWDGWFAEMAQVVGKWDRVTVGHTFSDLLTF